mgnify:FL=1
MDACEPRSAGESGRWSSVRTLVSKCSTFVNLPPETLETGSSPDQTKSLTPASFAESTSSFPSWTSFAGSFVSQKLVTPCEAVVSL